MHLLGVYLGKFRTVSIFSGFWFMNCLHNWVWGWDISCIFYCEGIWDTITSAFYEIVKPHLRKIQIISHEGLICLEWFHSAFSFVKFSCKLRHMGCAIPYIYHEHVFLLLHICTCTLQMVWSYHISRMGPLHTSHSPMLWCGMTYLTLEQCQKLTLT